MMIEESTQNGVTSDHEQWSVGKETKYIVRNCRVAGLTVKKAPCPHRANGGGGDWRGIGRCRWHGGDVGIV